MLKLASLLTIATKLDRNYMFSFILNRSCMAPAILRLFTDHASYNDLTACGLGGTLYQYLASKFHFGKDNKLSDTFLVESQAKYIICYRRADMSKICLNIPKFTRHRSTVQTKTPKMYESL